MNSHWINRISTRARSRAQREARVRIGSDEHKELFCRSFIATHLVYEPRELPWPELDDISLARLRAIPIWSTALQIELNAGEMVTGFAQTLSDPLLREAVALQGAEEARHARMIGTMVERYGLSATTQPPWLQPTEPAFIHFGYRECMDSFFGFGAFRIAREARFLPDALVSLFSRVLAEEARHIVFFVNWIAYQRVRQGRGAPLLQASATALAYIGALVDLVKSSRDAQKGSGMFTDTEAFVGLTLAKFLEACLAENDEQMAAFDSRLLRPRVIPAIAQLALGALRGGERLGQFARTRFAR